MDFKLAFRESVSIILSKWTPLYIAVKEKFAGGETLTRWLVHDLADEMVEYFESVGKTYDFEEICAHLADVMDTDFNTAIEDKDAEQPAQMLIDAFEFLANNSSEYLDKLRLSHFKLLDGLKPEDWVYFDTHPEEAKNKPEDYDESDDEDDDEEVEEEAPVSTSQEAAKPAPKKSNTSGAQPPDYFFEMRPKAPSQSW